MSKKRKKSELPLYITMIGLYTLIFAVFVGSFLTIVTLAAKEEEMTMTNYDYIMSKITDVDLAIEMTIPYGDSTKVTIFQQADEAFWRSDIANRTGKPENILYQIWLSKQYNPAEWESGN